MSLRTFKATTMAGALALVKKELGKEAVILGTRTVREGGLLGLGGRRMVEITATTQIRALARPRAGFRMGAGRPESGAVTEGAVAAVNAAPLQPAAMESQLARQVERLTSLVLDLAGETRRARVHGLPRELASAYETLVESQVAEDIACQLVEQLKAALPAERWSDRGALNQALAGQISRLIPTTGPLALHEDGRPYKVALVGPTGVGKTTTIAKLAAHHSLCLGKRVGLLTTDTYRIAAVEQLRTYADILSVPLQVVLAPRELGAALAELADRELILIDTAGRSQNDQLRLNQLQQFLRAARVDETHLVLSMTGGEKTLLQAAERFCTLGVDRILFTKADECVGFGMILNVLRRVNRKMSYLTDGQEVPDHIQVGRADEVAQMILRSRSAASA